MADWNGHMPATTRALLASMTRATATPLEVSQDDRILFTACEFWASARHRGLFHRLRNDAVAQLSAAETAFHVIGTQKVARVLREAQDTLTSHDPPVPLQDLCESLQVVLATIDEPVDRLLAEFASRLTSKLK